VIVIREDGTRWQCELLKEDGSKGDMIWLQVGATLTLTLTLPLPLPLPLPLTPIMTGCQVDADGESPLKAVAPKLFTLTFGEPKPSPYP